MRGNRAFTLIELVLVIVILGLIAAVAITRIAASASDAKKNTCATNTVLINRLIEYWAVENDQEYLHDQGKFQTFLLDNVAYFPDGPPVCPYGDAYKYDAATNRVTPHSH
jgi:prepilin-type N-terminal cleavage/methylation domain-containing protein